MQLPRAVCLQRHVGLVCHQTLEGPKVVTCERMLTECRAECKKQRAMLGAMESETSSWTRNQSLAGRTEMMLAMVMMCEDPWCCSGGRHVANQSAFALHRLTRSIRHLHR